MSCALPPRPYLPPALAAALVMWASMSILTELSWGAFSRGGPAIHPGCAPVAFVGIALLLATRACRLDRWRRSLAWIGCALVLSASSSALWAGGLDADASRLRGTASAYLIEVASDASVGAQGASMSATVRNGDRDELGRVRLTLPDGYAKGDILSVVGHFERLGTGDWERSRFMKGEVASLSGRSARLVSRDRGLLLSAREAMSAAIDPASDDSRALVAGVVCGTTTELAQTDAFEAFSRTGLSHLVAVSGGHLVLVIALARVLVQHAFGSKSVRSMVLGALCAAYAAFTGGAPSAVRSAAMVCLGLAAAAGTRRAHGISSLSLAILALLALNPGLAHDLGFQLSAASVLFLGVFGGYIAVLLVRMHLPLAIAEALAATLAAQWATLPLTVPVFGSLPLISPLANIVVGPLMSGVLATGLLCTPLAAIAPPLEPIMAVPVGLANLSIFFARMFASLPFACISVDLGGIAVALPYALAATVYVRWPDMSGRALGASLACIGLACGMHAFAWLYCAPPSVTVLDVGQGDSILIRDRGRAVLVDAGVDDEVVRALARNNVFRLDAVVITHWDRDHWGGLPALFQSFDIETVYVGPGASAHVPAELGGTVADACIELDYRDVVHVGGFACRAVWPRRVEQGDENASSLVLHVRYESDGSALSVLLTGDAEAAQVRQLVGEVGDIDVLKLGHHGSADSVDGDVLSALEPELAVASAGRDNPYGHPAKECVDAVRQHGSTFACTADRGDIRLEPAQSGFVVAMERPG